MRSLLGTMGWMPSERRETTCTSRAATATTCCSSTLAPACAACSHPLRPALLEGATESTCSSRTTTSTTPAVWRTCPACSPADASRSTRRRGDHRRRPGAGVAGLLRRPTTPRTGRAARRQPRAAGARACNDVAGHEIRVRRQQHSDMSVVVARRRRLRASARTRWPIPRRRTSPQASACCSTRPGTPPSRSAHGRRAGSAARRLRLAQRGDGRRALAASAGVRRLVLIHLNPLHDES